MKINVIITGATGMVGEGVLHECLNHPDVESVLVINRRNCNIQHPKLKELIHEDFSDFTNVENELMGYNAAFLCMGITSAFISEEKYSHVTYDLTMALAEPLSKLNTDMTLCYVSGLGTDSSEKGRLMWTRVKGKTENALLKLSTKGAYMFRPGFIRPTKGLNNTYTFYKIVDPFYPILKALFPKQICTLKEIGLAMINTVLKGYGKEILEVSDIERCANSGD